MIADGRKQEDIAAKIGCSRSLVSDIATGRRHKDTEGRLAYDPTDKRIQELETEVLHLRDERDHARRSSKAMAKTQGLFKAVVDELEERITPLTPLPREPKVGKSEIEEHLVMHLSDGHHDQIVSPEECGGMEEYNFEISCRRAETYVDTVLDWTQKTLAPRFRFPVLHVLAYGDHTSGEIHGHAARSAFRNQFKNSFAIGQLHAAMYHDLAQHFEQVNVVYVPGNHGRRSPKKDFHGAHDNWDYLIAEVARMHCREHKNVSFLIPDAFSVNLLINGVGFNVAHGDDIRGNNGIPFYNMTRRQKSLMAMNAARGEHRVRYFCVGHHHVAASLADIDGEMIVNGSWVGTDSYAFNSFSGYREPSQWIHGVNPKHGITWRMAVHLRSKGEKKGPTRYKIGSL